jgi:long-chain acyl-CoA synthetase
MLLARHAVADPGRPAIVSPSGDRTFGELNGRANQLARALRRRGLRAGDAVAVLCSNRPEFAEVYFATQRAGFRLTPVNWHLTADEGAYIVANCEARAFIADARFAAIAPAMGGAVTERLAVGAQMAGFDSYETALAGEDSADIDDATLGSTMLYTSGTTGRPKGVYRSRPAVTSPVLATLLGYRPGEDRDLCTGPLYHAAPLAFSLALPLSQGVGVVLMDHWEPEQALALIEQHQITHSHMVPTMFHQLLSLPDEVRGAYDVSSLRSILHGAAPCPVAVKSRLIEWVGPIVSEYYAATEGTATFVDSPTWLAKPGTVGRPDPPEQVKVADEAGNELAAGEVGLVYLRAPATGRFEYFKDQTKTDSAYQGDYFTLGDMGYFDQDGYLFLTDRTANLIISGGVNIYPAEVDAVILEHPAVADVATIGVPNEEWGEEVRAVVQLRPGLSPADAIDASALAASIVAHCREHLAGYKCPRQVDFTDELPRQDNGKIYKRVLRDRYRAQAAQEAQAAQPAQAGEGSSVPIV